MLPKLLLALTLVPLLELFLLIQLGQVVGALPTVSLVLLTGLAGALLLHRQGSHALRRIRSRFQQGELPTRELVDGLLLLVAALLLLTPGVLTDLLGIFLLIPAGRALARRLLQRRWEQWVRDHQLDPP